MNAYEPARLTELGQAATLVLGSKVDNPPDGGPDGFPELTVIDVDE